ncbi:MAG: alpha/beta hydrolase-fold protein [Bacteroidota bacterium]
MKYLLSVLLCLSFWAISSAQLTIVVDQLPVYTPPDDPIYVAGTFNNWSAGAEDFKMTRDIDSGVFYIDISQGDGTATFKFTRGEWAKVEADAQGNYRPDRSVRYAAGDTLRFQIAGWEDLRPGGGSGTAAPNVQILTDSFYMPQLDRYRRVWLYLPPDYASSNKFYPVLYLQDGQNVFNAATSFSGEWQVDETLNSLFEQGDPGAIAVAIDNGAGSLRMEEYAPWVNQTYGGGSGDAYVQFIINTLKPYIDEHYRTKPQREHTAIIGSSLGGLIAAYAGIEYPEVFGKVGPLSPAYWFNPEIYELVADREETQPFRMYQLVGTQEGASTVTNVYRMENALRAKGYDLSDLLTVEQSDGTHSEWFWAREFKDAYLWLFRQETTSIGEPSNHLRSTLLFPNPVNDQLGLKLELTQSSKMTIDVLDLLGTPLQSIFEGTLASGQYQLSWNLKVEDWPVGIYFCRIRGESGQQVLKFQVRR